MTRLQARLAGRGRPAPAGEPGRVAAPADRAGPQPAGLRRRGAAAGRGRGGGGGRGGDPRRPGCAARRDRDRARAGRHRRLHRGPLRRPRHRAGGHRVACWARRRRCRCCSGLAALAQPFLAPTPAEPALPGCRCRCGCRCRRCRRGRRDRLADGAGTVRRWLRRCHERRRAGLAVRRWPRLAVPAALGGSRFAASCRATGPPPRRTGRRHRGADRRCRPGGDGASPAAGRAGAAAAGVGRRPRRGLAELARRGELDPAPLADRVTLGRHATTTAATRAETAAWAQANGIHSLIVVTAGYHMPRAHAGAAAAPMPDIRLAPYPGAGRDRRSGSLAARIR